MLTEDRWAGRSGPIDFPTPVSALARIRVPKKFNHRSPHARRDLASTLRNARLENDLGARRVRQRSAPPTTRCSTTCGAPCVPTPCTGCPTGRSGCAGPTAGCARCTEADAVQRTMAERTGCLTRQFDATCDVLEELGYLVPEVVPLVEADTEVIGAEDDVPVVTDDGRRLSRIWSEADLLVAECLRAGIWRGLAPAELAASVSTLVFEARRELAGLPAVPAGKVARAIAAMRRSAPGCTRSRSGTGCPTPRLDRASPGRLPVGRRAEPRPGARRRRAGRHGALGRRLRPLGPAADRPPRPARQGAGGPARRSRGPRSGGCGGCGRGRRSG